jgi:AraC-like DNA-binding protein
VPAPAATIPSSRLDTDGLSGPQRFEAWRDSVAPLFDCQFIDPDDALDFQVDTTVLDLGDVLFAESRANALRFERSSRLIRRGGIDHFLIQWYRRGGYQGDHARDRIRVDAGEIGVLDLGREFLTQTKGRHFENRNVFIPRSLLLPRMRRCRDPRSLRLSGTSVLGRILTGHLETTWAEIPRADAAESTAIAESIVDIVATCLDAGDTIADPPSVLDSASGRAMRDFVEANLTDENLGPDLLCATFRCSRSYLYRAFRGEGGLVPYIQTRRLLQVHRELTSSGVNAPTLSELAYKWGFAGHSHLSRRFRAQFGMTPTDARDLGRQSAALRPQSEGRVHDGVRKAPAYRDWLQQLADA